MYHVHFSHYLILFCFGKHVRHSLAYPLTLMSHLQISYADACVLNDQTYDNIFPPDVYYLTILFLNCVSEVHQGQRHFKMQLTHGFIYLLIK